MQVSERRQRRRSFTWEQGACCREHAGVAGALIGWGIPEDDAKYYESEVQAGRYLVTVECGQGDDARDLLRRHGGYDRTSARV